MKQLVMSDIAKSFSGIPALSGVGFDVRSGEVHALLGANGAGKSTLMKILSGAYISDSGTISIDGQAVSIRTPSDAKAQGIHCVYQEVDTVIIPHLSVAENIMLDRLAASGGGLRLVNWKGIEREAAAMLERLGASIPVRKLAGDLTLAEKQLVVIARLLTEQAKYVIFDEPTAPLSLEEAERLFRVIAGLKKDGIGIIFISHRLPEVFRLCNRITVMRDGVRVLTAEAAASSPEEVVTAMLGRSLEEEFPKVDAAIGDIALRVEGLRMGKRVRDVSFEARSGEIVAIVGLVGAGKTELSRVLFGADPREAGTVSVKGRAVLQGDPAQAIVAGIALVPEERRKQGVLVNENVVRNLSLPFLKALSRLGIVSGAKESAAAESLIKRLGIKTSSSAEQVAHLSGGNQQKVSIGKWLPTGAEVFLFDEPTKGVDVGAKSDIFGIIGELAQQGKTIIYLTCEFSEAIGIADRILVMCDGEIVKQFARGEATQEELLLHASGGRGDN
ncbi:sugar ABC transporter ATP-binding protein [Paenibacillus sp. MMS18-CY102]|uniref:sugar ABC transporter ATP-binding protein n=1 Tax=Paenibacillus sp. MMS18-CY102 TaxID=2682849 RepID=UPI001365A630|nr:sugar ABC transporter ATP-binding protein [Paenibacillus sp. MMS18-CY102]MWC28459.1 ATP-binding cassette domain-containing protein [Paenibacillus sp. MMS18-CY102]